MGQSNINNEGRSRKGDSLGAAPSHDNFEARATDKVSSGMDDTRVVAEARKRLMNLMALANEENNIDSALDGHESNSASNSAQNDSYRRTAAFRVNHDGIRRSKNRAAVERSIMYPSDSRGASSSSFSSSSSPLSLRGREVREEHHANLGDLLENLNADFHQPHIGLRGRREEVIVHDIEEDGGDFLTILMARARKTNHEVAMDMLSTVRP